MKSTKIDDEKRLLEMFNKRESIAFGDIYTSFYREFYLYVRMLYRDTEVSSDDVIHDIFVNMWLSKTIFESVFHIKSYVYLSIKNNFRNYLAHGKHRATYRENVREYYDLDIVESELYSLVDEALQFLPETYAQILKMYLDGWKSGEIAAKLGRTEQYVYNIKYDAILLLKKKMSKNRFFILFSILS